MNYKNINDQKKLEELSIKILKEAYINGMPEDERILAKKYAEEGDIGQPISTSEEESYEDMGFETEGVSKKLDQAIEDQLDNQIIYNIIKSKEKDKRMIPYGWLSALKIAIKRDNLPIVKILLTKNNIKTIKEALKYASEETNSFNIIDFIKKYIKIKYKLGI